MILTESWQKTENVKLLANFQAVYKNNLENFNITVNSWKLISYQGLVKFRNSLLQYNFQLNYF